MEYLIGLLVLLLFALWVGYNMGNKPQDLEELGRLKEQSKFDRETLLQVSGAYVKLKEDYAKILGQKKSSEVKTGFMAEALLPLTEQFPCDPKSLRFLGAPVDYIAFDYQKGEITFIECKTGDSQLNEHQRQVRDMIESGRVKFVTVRLNEKGIKVK